MTLALYRKYRPATFAEVIGQEHVTEPLRQALRHNRVHHAYLFSGPRGCGKTSSARILARSLNCEQGPTPDPCGVCQSCRDLAPSGPGNVDVIEIDAASHGGVDDARDLRERSFYAPAVSRFKVYIIDEAHMVTAAGFNALLKLVEEPPPHLKFVFATTEPDKVLPTIKSRTHHYPFRLVPPAVLRQHLAHICEQEKVAIEPGALNLVVRAGAGSVRDALSILDQLIAGAGSEGVTHRYAAALLGYTDAALLDEAIEGLARGDGPAVFSVVTSVIDAGHDPRRFAEDILQRLRDLIVVDAVPDAPARGLLDVPEDAMDRMRRQAAAFGRTALLRAAEIVSAGLAEMRGSVAPRLVLELIVARLLVPAADRGETGVLARLERIERRLGLSAGGSVAGELPDQGQATGPSTRPSRAVDEPVRHGPAVGEPGRESAQPRTGSRPSAREAVESSAGPPGREAVDSSASPRVPRRDAPADQAAVLRAWDDVLEATKQRRRVAHSLLISGPAQVVDVRGSTIVVGFTTPALERQFALGPRNEEALAGALTDVLGGQWRIETTVLGSTGSGPEVTGTAAVGAERPHSSTSGNRGAAEPRDPEPDDLPGDGVDPDDPPVETSESETEHLALLQRHLGATVIEEDVD
ncbi:DNA polymerase III, subunits gamma and tau [Acidothermus cellulolyticus 11B]|uniref:DNA polymerase III subunit gamma/tau n=1 Tax=Acidothermus cellulolyticus (strain ATCC 43068 / DSM 8971 / 11B) TaxID=351607 RepID=A0LWH8_ACIC1|nr:DNA polymerase III subunit gamma and tau [Acidothermus cellulolyticus]ABK53788.1 DNA polymerase III, subunits gamma and tau [Acidothermus cellulolyticus 11B]